MSFLDDLDAYVHDMTVATLPGGHWLPEGVNRMMRGFFGE